jgi:hypothetical protein
MADSTSKCALDEKRTTVRQGPFERVAQLRCEAGYRARPPVVSTGETVAGITGFDRLQLGIRGRDERGIAGSRRSLAPRRTLKLAELQVFYGSDGTRTRDLRRDRPVLALAG